MIDFKLNGKKLRIPSSWDEVTTGQYLQLLNLKEDYLQAVSIFSGVDYETFKKAVVIGLDDLIKTLSFIKNGPDLSKISDKVGGYDVPKNVQFETLAQFEDMRAVIQKCNGIMEVTKAYPQIVAIYLQKIRDKEYDYTKSQLMVDEVLTMPAKEVITVGAFFYVKLTSLLRGTQTTSPPTTQSPKKSKQGSRKSVKRSARR